MNGLRLTMVLASCMLVCGCGAFTQAPPIDEPVAPTAVPAPVQAKCAEPEPCVCPVPETIEVPVPMPIKESCPETGVNLPVLGGVEWVLVDADGARAKARIDTGAKTSSMHAEKLQEFERDGKPWVSFQFNPDASGNSVKMERPVERRVRIKLQDGSTQRRYVVKLLLAIGDIQENIEISLNDRSDFEYPVLIGRNFLTDNALVDVSRKFVVKQGTASSSNKK
jgi:hypothetical protein